ncbi:hypothetical protein KUCAC02_021323, partial [Chaenocephalus aceratus]
AGQPQAKLNRPKNPHARLDVLCVVRRVNGRQEPATEGGEHLKRGARVKGVWW